MSNQFIIPPKHMDIDWDNTLKIYTYQSKNILLFYFVISILSITAISCNSEKSIKQGPYLGQDLPGNEPVLFAPGIINTGMPTRDITFTPDGKEIYFGVNIGNSTYTILYCKEDDSGWSVPEVIPFATDPKFVFLEPFISPDGSKFFFVSNKGNSFTATDKFITDIWVANREGNWWGEPYKLDTIINTERAEFFPSVSKNGNLYFTRKEGSEFIFCSEYKNGKYEKPVKLPAQVNGGRARYNATISADEDFIIVPVYGLPDSKGATDYYISFNHPAKGWSELISVGDKVNSESRFDYSAGFSPDKKYFFFTSSKIQPPTEKKLSADILKKMYNLPENGNSNIYWIKADFLNDLKQNAIYPDN